MGRPIWPWPLGCFNYLLLCKGFFNLIFYYLGSKNSFSNSLLHFVSMLKSHHFHLNSLLSYDYLLKATNFRNCTLFQPSPNAEVQQQLVCLSSYPRNTFTKHSPWPNKAAQTASVTCLSFHSVTPDFRPSVLGKRREDCLWKDVMG